MGGVYSNGAAITEGEGRVGGQEGDQGVQLRGRRLESRRSEEKKEVGEGGEGGPRGRANREGQEGGPRGRARREGKEGRERVFLACQHCCHEVVKVSNSCSPFPPAQSTEWQVWRPENCA